MNIKPYWKTDWSEKDLEFPKADLVDGTDRPIKRSCLSARGDYSDEYVYEGSYKEAMEDVDGGTLKEKETNLLKKCMQRGHWGIFEHSFVVFGVKRMSRVCMAQITRHRHLSFDVQSMRYVDFGEAGEEDFYTPPTMKGDQVKTREGTDVTSYPEYFGKAVTETMDWGDAYHEEVENSLQLYNTMVDAGVPKEHARMVLPLGTRVNCTVSMNLRSFFHLLEIRGAGDAQGEINYLTYNMAQAFASVYPDLAEIYFEHSFMKPKRLSP